MMIVGVGCAPKEEVAQSRLVVLDPGHFHASLLQKNELPAFAPTVAVYAPEGAELEQYIGFVEGYNSRENNPTHWVLDTYAGEDYLDRMVAEHKGDVVVLAGNNRKKTQYIYAAVEAGYNVLADKPMAISTDDYTLLKEAYALAAEKGVVIYEMMTERYDVKNILEKKILANEALFGTLTQGTPEEPAVYQESVHHFCKMVSGKPSVRPAWYYDVEQQGEGIVDVTTHLVDLVQCTVKPEQEIDYQNDIKFTSARRWATKISRDKYRLVTGKEDYPAFLQKDIVNDTLHVYSNGEMNYQLDGVNCRVSVVWNFMAEVGTEGTGDTHYSVVKGTKSNIEIRQGAEQGYKPMLYVVNKGSDADAFEATLRASLKSIEKQYPGLDIRKVSGNEWQVVIPSAVVKTHEMRFSSVMKVYLDYLKQGEIPAWERSHLKSKYYTTTKAFELAR